MMASQKKLLVMAVAMVFLFFVADSVLARGGRGGGGRGGGGRSSGKSFSRHSGGSNHSIRNSGSRSSRSRQSYSRGSRQSYGGGSRGGRYDRPSTGRPGYDRPSTGRPGNRPGNRPGRPGDGNYKDPYSQAYKNQKSWQNTRQQIAKDVYDDRRDWVEDNWYYGRGRYAGVRIYYSVPCSYTVNVVNGHTYYQCGSVWYDRVYSTGQVTYIVVTAP